MPIDSKRRRKSTTVSEKVDDKTGDTFNLSAPVALSAFLTPYEVNEDEDEENPIGIGSEDLLSPKYTEFIQLVLSQESCVSNNQSLDTSSETAVIHEKWKFSSLLTPVQVTEMLAVLNSAKIWEGIGCLNTGEYIPMPIKDEFKGKTSIVAPYPMSFEKRKAFDSIMKELENQGIVEDAEPTKYCSPCLIVMQKNKPRLVIDFRKINDMTPVDVYPLPRQKDIFNALQSAEYISLFDFKKAFFQFPVHPDDREKVTFSTRHGGAKRLTRSLMEYINSPAHCQRVVDRIIKRFRWINVIIYVDDIIVFSRSWEEHLAHVNWVLQEIEKVGLTLDPSKAHIGFRSVDLLGHNVNKFGLTTQAEKIRAMNKLPKPETLHDLRMELGFFGYYRDFIRCFAQIVSPLTTLLAALSPKDSNLPKTERSSRHMFQKIRLQDHWLEEHQHAFDLVKQKLSEASSLSHAIESDKCQYILYVDACKLGFGAALHVKVPVKDLPEQIRPRTSKDFCERPICFISRSLTKTEKNYWPTELEMGALVWSLKKLEEIIEGKPLMIYTDHSALTWLFSSSDSKGKYNQRLMLWTLAIQHWRHKATIVHRPGRSHLNADVLSRYPVDSETPETLKRSLTNDDCPIIKSESSVLSTVSSVIIDSKLMEQMRTGYAQDRHWVTLLDKLKNLTPSEYHSFKLDDQGLIQFVDPQSKQWRLCVPSNCHTELFTQYHDRLGHCGFRRTYHKLSSIVHMPALSKRLKAYIHSCPTCAVAKGKNHTGGILHPLELPAKPFDTIAMDFVVALPLSDGFDAVLTITDKFTKVVSLIACKTTDSAVDTARRWLESYYSRYGIPRNIISDRDVKFISAFWRELFKLLDCKLLMSTAFSPQTDGQSERTNQTMEVMLRTLLSNKDFTDWKQLLPLVEFSINSMKSESSLHAPFELLYGSIPRSLPDMIISDRPEISNIPELRTLIRKEAIDHLGHARALMALHYDKGRHETLISVGDEVYIENRPSLSIPGLSSAKLGPKRFGPFKVIENVGKGACRLDLPENYRMHPVLSHRQLTVKRHDPEFNRVDLRPPPEVYDHALNEGEFEVERVRDKRTSCNGKKTEYLVKWVGYPDHESTWIDSKEADSFGDLVSEFENRRSTIAKNNKGQTRLRRSGKK